MSKEMLGKVIKGVGMGMLAGLVISKGADMIANAMVKKLEKETSEEVNEVMKEERKSFKREIKTTIEIGAAACLFAHLIERKINNVKNTTMLNTMMIYELAYQHDMLGKEDVVALCETIAKFTTNKNVRDIALDALKNAEEVL